MWLVAGLIAYWTPTKRVCAFSRPWWHSGLTVLRVPCFIGASVGYALAGGTTESVSWRLRGPSEVRWPPPSVTSDVDYVPSGHGQTFGPYIIGYPSLVPMLMLTPYRSMVRGFPQMRARRWHWLPSFSRLFPLPEIAAKRQLILQVDNKEGGDRGISQQVPYSRGQYRVGQETRETSKP